MTEDASRQIDLAVFEGALSIDDPEAREAFVSQACANDPDRRTRVESWLNARGQADHYFRAADQARAEITQGVADSLPPSSSTQDLGPDPDGPGSQLGPYTLMERLGEGGCGVVYLAEQREPLRRRVALKIIRLGLDTEKVVARFETERQALALMDHPNIARVLDAGTTDSGRPYFVMELVHGTRITEHCDSLRLGLKQRLELFIQVCNAIQHAHQKGIIHRDIKPSNVMVSVQDGVAVPKVIDFGIVRAVEGRLTGDTSLTRGDQMIGTPAYMSPEQAEGSQDLDTRGDEYSLGVLLCELLTGETPFDGQRLAQAGVLEMLRILRETEAPAPSSILAKLNADELTAVAAQRNTEPRQLMASIRGDLDWIVLKTLSKDRQSRYPTVNGLATDLQRFLNDEPVIARPPGRVYLLGKFARRNKVTIVSAAVVLFALVAGLAVSSWFYLREKDARTVQVRLRQVAETAQVNESRLLQQAKARESVSQAAILLAEGKVEEADALLAKTPLTSIEPSLEAANLFRSLGTWNAVQQRWRQAGDCFSLFLQANRSRPALADPRTQLTIGTSLVAGGNLTEYHRFQDEAITAYGKGRDPIDAAIVIKSCLLLPADNQLVERLRPAADRIVESLAKDDKSRGIGALQSAWIAMSLELIEYRRGNFTQALECNRLCLAFPDTIQARSAAAHAIAAMAAYRLGQTGLARSELVQAQQLFVAPFEMTSTPRGVGQGLWEDWVIARVLLREATAVVENDDQSGR